MPGPLSSTVRRTDPSSASRRTSTRPVASGTNLIALDSRFQTICCRRFGVARERAGPRVDERLEAHAPGRGRRPQAVDRGLDHARQLDRLRRPGAACRRRCARCRGCPRSAAPGSGRCGGSSPPPSGSSRRSRCPSRSRWLQPTIALSGVRSSCDSTARKSSFRWSASSAARYSSALSIATAARWARSSATRRSVGLVAALGPARGEREHATRRAVPGQHRHAQVGGEAQLAKRPTFVGLAHPERQVLLAHALHELRAAGRGDEAGARLVARLRQPAAGERARRLRRKRLGVRDHQPLQDAPVADEVRAAPVREEGHRQARHLLQDRRGSPRGRPAPGWCWP